MSAPAVASPSIIPVTSFTDAGGIRRLQQPIGCVNRGQLLLKRNQQNGQTILYWYENSYEGVFDTDLGKFLAKLPQPTQLSPQFVRWELPGGVENYRIIDIAGLRGLAKLSRRR